MSNDKEIDAIGGVSSSKAGKTDKAGEAGASSLTTQPAQAQQTPQQNPGINTQDTVSISKEARGLE